MSTEGPIANPYVGPRTFSYEQRHLFFGREPEARDLLARMLSERLLLFYAQSGAGKSSLLSTRLIPQLEEKGFVVLPVGRVGGELPAGVEQVEDIYAYNLMVSIDEGGDPARLAHVTLSDFLARLARKTVTDATGQERKGWAYDVTLTPSPPPAGPTARRLALIIDQFEEIVTTHPGRWRERDDFFRQLDQAMQAYPSLWVVLTLREDYVAALDPYAPLMADRLRARFYMERMGVDAALEAIRQPAALAGRPFAEGVAEQLVDNLRQVRVPGQENTIPGQYVEPVQLQVVCYQLWENLGKGTEGTQINFEDLAEAGDVNRALTQFYEETLAAALADSAATGVGERQLRTWFDGELITDAGTRGLVHQDANDTGGLPNAMVKALQRRFLVRGEARSGDTWIELVHDRFVEPIRQSNRAWFARNLNPLTVAAQAWRDANENPARLYTGSQLASAVAQLDAKPEEFGELERDFLKASQGRAQHQSARRWRLALTGAVILILILAGLTGWALHSTAKAKASETEANKAQATAVAAEREAATQARLARRSLAGQLAAQAPTDDSELGYLLAVEAAKLSNQEGDSPVPAAYQRLLDARKPELFGPGHASAIRLLARVPGSDQYVSVDDTSVLLWQPLASSETPVTTTLLTGSFISAAALSPDRRWLAVAGTPESKAAAASAPGSTPGGPNSETEQRRTLPSVVHLWDLAGTDPTQGTTPVDLEGTATTLVFAPDGRLVIGCDDGRVYIWDRKNRYWTSHTVAFKAHASPVSASVVGGPGGRWLALGAKDGLLRLWDLDAVAERPNTAASATLQGHKDGITALAISEDSRWLASGDASGAVRLWRLARGTEARPLEGSPGPDATPMPRGSPSPQPMAMTLSVDERPIILLGHEGTVNAVAFSPDNRWLVTAGADGIARLWDVAAAAPATRPITLRGHEAGINAAFFDSASQRLFTGGSDNNVGIWDLSVQTPGLDPIVLFAGSGVTAMDLDEPNDRLAGGSSEGWALVWHLRLDELIASACNSAGRNLTADEWDKFVPGETYHKVCPDFPIHPSVVERHLVQGRALAAAGDIIEAEEEFRQAAELDPSLGIVPADGARAALVDSARALARSGELEDALARYEKAGRQDETLKLDAAELKQLDEARKLVQVAQKLARDGASADALAMLRTAKDKDPSLAFDPEGYVRSLLSSSPTAFMSDFIYGLHDPGGEQIMLDAGKPGWIVFKAAIGHDAQDQSSADYSSWSDRGLGVIVVLVNGYQPEGTLPNSADYADFAARCANFVSNSRGARVWVIGNEMNHPLERPGVEYDYNQSPPRLIQPGEIITPELYARAYRLCRDAIHGVPGHASDEVLIGAVAPWNTQTVYPGNPTGDWVKYFRDILTLLGPANCDGFTIHTYTHGGDPKLVYTDALMNPPFQNRQYNFRAYRDFMNAVPDDMRHLPAYITETDQDAAWKNENTGWVRQAYAEIDGWNSQPSTQKIRALVLYRWPKVDQWYIEGKQGVIDDFIQALAQNYVWRSNPPPPISFIADQLPKHPTKVWEQRSLPEITHIVVHSTASPANVSAERIADYHVQTMGWPGIGYHFFIGPSGAIEQTNPLEAASFHASGAEDFSIGIAFAGSFDDAIPTPQQIESGARLIAWLMMELNIPIEQVMGHNEMPGSTTSDPGIQWLEGQRWKDMLLGRVDEILKSPAPALAPTATVTP